ncbi:hypothetical protein [Kitasatospora sp. HPMI-4]|uniref:hypothetical protein n=1 Tax=Kitasatospora sp. HPMI-4 TaxID=3448443 RepID=UPI003F1A88EC
MGRARRPGVTRLLAVCAVLLGLFLMHGSPTSALGECHGGMAASAPMPDGHAMAGPVLAGDPAKPFAHTGAMPQAGGSECVSTPARDRLPAPATGSVAGAVILAFSAGLLRAGRPPGRSSHRRRGPPAGGRGLLLQVCVART